MTHDPFPSVAGHQIIWQSEISIVAVYKGPITLLSPLWYMPPWHRVSYATVRDAPLDFRGAGGKFCQGGLFFLRLTEVDFFRHPHEGDSFSENKFKKKIPLETRVKFLSPPDGGGVGMGRVIFFLKTFSSVIFSKQPLLSNRRLWNGYMVVSYTNPKTHLFTKMNRNLGWCMGRGSRQSCR